MYVSDSFYTARAAFFEAPSKILITGKAGGGVGVLRAAVV